MNNPLITPTGMLQVLFLAAEADPFIKVGGLGDVAGSLPSALRALDPSQTGGKLLDVRLVIPFHGAISLRPEDCKPVLTFPVVKPGETVEARVFVTQHHGMPVYLIAGDPIPPEAPVYSMNTAQDGLKFTFFSLASLELAKQLGWQPDIIHANDWHTAIAVYELKQRKLRQDTFFDNTRSILTIHNLPFMGAGTAEDLSTYGIPFSANPNLPTWGRSLPLPMGMSAADQIVTVSPNYAQEILTPEYGCNLQDFLKTRKESLTGILNGIDQDIWDPSTDSIIAQNYSINTLLARNQNKKELLEEFSLKSNPDVPLLIFIGRMDQQKGVDIAVEALRMVSDTPWQAILLGTGEPNLENEVRRFESDFPDRVRAAIQFDPHLSRRLYASADCLLMPSRYEPCGLAQMIAMRYGCVPVARATGGLQETIIDQPDPAQSTGFLFQNASATDLADTLRRTFEQYQEHAIWRARQVKGMQQDFSWQRSAVAYAGLYSSGKAKS